MGDPTIRKTTPFIPMTPRPMAQDATRVSTPIPILNTPTKTPPSTHTTVNSTGQYGTTTHDPKEVSFPGKNQHAKQTGHTEHHAPPTVAGTVAHDVSVNAAHHGAEHAIEHVASHAGERAAEHAAGEVIGHGAGEVLGRIGSVAAPGIGAVAAGYLAATGIQHSIHASQRGNTGAALAFALAATVDGTTAAVNAAGAVSGAGTVISTPVSIALGAVATGFSALGAYLDK